MNAKIFCTIFVILGIFAPAAGFAAGPARIFKLTEAMKFDEDYGDPSAPDFSEPGFVKVYTTNGCILIWEDKAGISAVQNFLAGHTPRLENLKLRTSDGLESLEAWDPSAMSFEEFGGEKFIYAGIATDASGLREGRWPEDNWRRRVNAFRWNEKIKAWVQVPGSMLGRPYDEPTWEEHSYGHHFVRDSKKRPWMFYEKVQVQQNGMPWTTALFARRVESPLKLSEREVLIFDPSKDRYPSTVRGFGGTLAEGPRPFRVGSHYLVAFSGGDYMSDRYGIHLLWSKAIDGPYTPYLTPSGNDLKDFGQSIEKDLPLTWGAARPVFFEAEGDWWVLFHGIDRKHRAQVERGVRDVYLAPVKIQQPADGPPILQIQAQ